MAINPLYFTDEATGERVNVHAEIKTVPPRPSRLLPYPSRPLPCPFLFPHETWTVWTAAEHAAAKARAVTEDDESMADESTADELFEIDELFDWRGWHQHDREAVTAVALLLFFIALLWILVPVGMSLLGPAAGSLAGAK